MGRRPWRLDPVAALVSVLPDGTLDLPAHAAAIERALGTDWPADDLWICTLVTTTSVAWGSGGPSRRR